MAETHGSHLCDAYATFDISDVETHARLIDVLDDLSRCLASDIMLRQEIGSAAASPWPPLSRLWKLTAQAHSNPVDVPEPRLRTLCMSLGRFTRNIVAAVPENQYNAFDNEPSIRILIHHYTAFSVSQDPASFAVARMLIQTLSNLVTANEALIQQLWDLYMELPEEKSILIRLFAFPDVRTVSSAFVFVLNCIHQNPKRAERLVSASSGTRLCVSLLDRIAILFDGEESHDSDDARTFSIGCEIITRIIEGGFAPKLYNSMSVQDEVVTPHQTVLLKLLDSYLHEFTGGRTPASRRQLPRKPIEDLTTMLTYNLFNLFVYVQRSILQFLGPSRVGPAEDARSAAAPCPDDDSPAAYPNGQLDLLLPKVCQAVVLVAQCLTSIVLREEESHSGHAEPRPADAEPAIDTRLASDPKIYLSGATDATGAGLIDMLIETLRLLDEFLPRMTFGKVVPRPAAPAIGGAGKRFGPGAEPQPAVTPPAPNQNSHLPESELQGFAYLKRDLVRLLGILCDHNTSVQDRVRECGGIPIIMNLCVVDDQNPYLREHAIFALRNLLLGNRKNQAVVDSIKPMGRWDENGVMQEIGP